jgi:hypothetical protein
MQFEPQWSLTIISVVGLAGLYLWYLIAQASIFDKVLAYPRNHWGPLIGCPWCAGFWITGLLLLATQSYDPLTHIATAGLVGILGTHSG